MKDICPGFVGFVAEWEGPLGEGRVREGPLVGRIEGGRGGGGGEGREGDWFSSKSACGVLKQFSVQVEQTLF